MDADAVIWINIFLPGLVAIVLLLIYARWGVAHRAKFYLLAYGLFGVCLPLALGLAYSPEEWLGVILMVGAMQFAIGLTAWKWKRSRSREEP